MVRAAICVLTRGYDDPAHYRSLIQRNRRIVELFAGTGAPDINLEFLIFHQGNISRAHQGMINAESGMEFRFMDVGQEFAFEAARPGSNEHCRATPLSEYFGDGYKAMCRFWFGGFFKHTSRYDYLVRIDEDCVVERFPLFDIIREMERVTIHYVAPSLWGRDAPDVTVGLERFAQDFRARHRAGPVRFDQNPYTNIFVMDLNYFRRSALTGAFIRDVERSRCIEINRWGDLPLWGVVLSLLGEGCRFFLCDGIVYFHGSHAARIEGQGRATFHGLDLAGPDPLLRPVPSASAVASAVAILRPKPSPRPLIRVGGDRDGAYLVPDDLVGIGACFSPGVNNVKRFEDDLTDRFAMRCHMCDRSSDVAQFATPLHPTLQTFRKLWLDDRDSDISVTLQTWIDGLELGSGDLMLQMDIEGAEYRTLLAVPDDIMARFRIMVLELHDLDGILDPQVFSVVLRPLLDKLDRDFVCVHAHPNNTGGGVDLPGLGMSLPRVLEVTFLRRDRFLVGGQRHPVMLPHPLDIESAEIGVKPLFLDAAWLDGPQRPESQLRGCQLELAHARHLLAQQAAEQALVHSRASANSGAVSRGFLRRWGVAERTGMPMRHAIEIADGKPFTLSSNYFAADALTGVVHSAVPFFFHTALGEYEFIRIDLGEAFLLSAVTVRNRTDACFDRARSLHCIPHVDAVPDRRLAIPLNIDEEFYAGSAAERVSTTILAGARARYVTIFAEEETYLHLESVEVFGVRPSAWSDDADA